MPRFSDTIHTSGIHVFQRWNNPNPTRTGTKPGLKISNFKPRTNFSRFAACNWRKRRPILGAMMMTVITTAKTMSHLSDTNCYETNQLKFCWVLVTATTWHNYVSDHDQNFTKLGEGRYRNSEVSHWCYVLKISVLAVFLKAWSSRLLVLYRGYESRTAYSK
jgi:hypothetical protein